MTTKTNPAPAAPVQPKPAPAKAPAARTGAGGSYQIRPDGTRERVRAPAAVPTPGTDPKE